MLILNRESLEEIIAQSKKELPNEACGILAGRNNRVEKVYAMVNVQKSPENFFMDAKEQLKAIKEMRNSGLEMVGIYHSHPISPAYPSAHDVEMAFYPEASYLILSLKDKTQPQARSFRITEGEIAEEELKIVFS